MTSVLMILSAADRWTLNDGTVHPSGFWAEEFIVPYDSFLDAGWQVDVATPGGVRPTVDRLSLGFSGGFPWTTRRLRRRLDELAPVLDCVRDLYTVHAENYDLLFYPGGHGPMEDLAHDEFNGALLARRVEQDRPLALLCHAPAAILPAKTQAGNNAFAGREMTGLSNREELLNRFAKKAPWLLEDRMKEAGVKYSKGLLPLLPHTVKDRNLYTGQNPQSSKKLAAQLIADLSPGGR